MSEEGERERENGLQARICRSGDNLLPPNACVVGSLEEVTWSVNLKLNLMLQYTTMVTLVSIGRVGI